MTKNILSNDQKRRVISTKERIVAQALALFNERGIEYTGMRELAASLGMRIGNITYYFPTKDDLVNRLALDLAELNSKALVAGEEPDLHSFLSMYKAAFRNHLQYRSLMLSFVHLIDQNPAMARRYKKTQKTRFSTLEANIVKLIKNKSLNAGEEEIEFLVSTIALIARFWISEARISYSHLKTEEQIAHYLGMLARVLLPYATAKGRREINGFISTIKN